MRIVVTGETGYIARNLSVWLTRYGHEVRLVSLRGELPDFSGTDVVIHAAAVVHRSDVSEKEFYDVNTALTESVAKKAKQQGVGRFVFFSTMAVYGDVDGIIDEGTPTAPVTDYGKSKLAAEERLAGLNGDGFLVSVVRPPVVYGRGAPGNVLRLAGLRVPVFPMVVNRRSMIFIDNLCEFVRLLVEDTAGVGVFCPQNREYVCTSELFRELAEVGGRRVWLSRALGRLINVLPVKPGVLQKLFGDLAYSKEMSGYFGYRYCVVDFRKSLELTV